ncbi:MAG: hypothetical protein WA659_01465 [Candidatus Aquirickettsiella sp.]
MFTRQRQQQNIEALNARLGIRDISSTTTFINLEDIRKAVLNNPEQAIPQEIAADEKFNLFWQDCKKEIDKMQKIKVGKVCSLYNLLINEKLKISQQNRKESLPNDCELAVQFPQYGSLITEKLTIATSRYQNILTISNQLQPVGINVEYPPECIESILDYCPNQDIKNVLTYVESMKKEAKEKSIKEETPKTSRQTSRLGSFYSAPIANSEPPEELEKNKSRLAGCRLFSDQLQPHTEEQEEKKKQPEVSRSNC